MRTLTVKDSTGTTQTINVGDANGLIAEAVSGPYAPGYDVGSDGGGSLQSDPDGQLRVRGPVLTDEGTFRANFANASIGVAIGSVTVANGATTATVSLTATTDLHAGDYIKLDADAESAWTQIDSVDSITSVTLAKPYPGTGGTGAASRAIMAPVTGAGGSISVASGQCLIASGTTDASQTEIKRDVDVAPLVFRARVAVSQRIANQTVFVGFREDATTPRWFARFEMDGTNASQVRTATGRNPTGAPSASEQETYAITLPTNGTTTTANTYRIELMAESVFFYINDFLVATHSNVIPAQHDSMMAAVRVLNGTGAASSTTLAVDYATCKNHNKLEVGIMSNSETVVANQPDAQLFSYNVSGVIAINTTLLQVDCRRFRSFDIHAISIGTTGVVTAQQSLDGGVNWASIAVVNLNTGAATTTLTSGASHRVIVGGGLFRLQLTTATTAGSTTIAMAATQLVNQFAPNTMSVNLTQISGAANSSGGATGGLGVGGFAAHSATASGNPIQIGGVASTALDTTIIAGDQCRVLMTTAQQLVTKPYGTAENDWQYTGILTTTTAAAAKAAGAASIRNYVTDISFQNTSATATTVLLLDGATTIAQWNAPASMAAPSVITFATPRKGTAATAMNVNCGTTGANVLINVGGYQSF